MQEQLHSTASGSIQALLQQEDQLPANCFQLNGTGKMHEGLDIELDHPLTGTTPAMFIGEYYLFRNSRCGCLYRSNGKTGTVRRMVIETRELDNGRKPLRLLSQPSGGDLPFYVLVNPVVELPKGVTSHVQFWMGVKHTGETAAKNFNGFEQLVALKEDGQSLDVFYADGRVVRIVREDDRIVDKALSIEQQADLRIQHALDGIRNAERLSGDERVKFIDKCLHQIVEVLEVGGKRSQEVFEFALGTLTTAAKKGMIRPNVKHRVLKVLSRQYAGYALQFNQDCERPVGHSGRIVSPIVASPVTVPAKPRGIPAHVKAKKAERSQRDADFRTASKGSSQEKPLSQKGGKGKKH